MQGMDYKDKIAKRIRAAREERGWKLRELAEATDNVVSISRLNNYEHGARMPGPAEAVLLGDALGKRPAYFLGVDDVQMPISPLEEALVRNWRTLPENERMELYRAIEVNAMRYRDPVQPHIAQRNLPRPPKVAVHSRRKSKAK
jgi:transcriptional regulator with XRE-family HTH domain